MPEPCQICHRPQATAADDSLWDAHQAGAPLPEGWHSENAEHLCWHAVCGQGCTPDEKSDPVAVAQRLIDEGADWRRAGKSADEFDKAQVEALVADLRTRGGYTSAKINWRATR